MISSIRRSSRAHPVDLYTPPTPTNSVIPFLPRALSLPRSFLLRNLSHVISLKFVITHWLSVGSYCWLEAILNPSNLFSNPPIPFSRFLSRKSFVNSIDPSTNSRKQSNRQKNYILCGVSCSTSLLVKLLVGCQCLVRSQLSSDCWFCLGCPPMRVSSVCC